MVILDIVMPGMDGWQVCQQIRQSRHIPVVMLTAKGQVRDMARGIGIGADDYLTKPFDPEQLVDRVEKTLRCVRFHRKTAPPLCLAGD